jgi:hypothetical protein
MTRLKRLAAALFVAPWMLLYLWGALIVLSVVEE